LKPEIIINRRGFIKKGAPFYVFEDYRKKPVVIQACQMPKSFSIETLEGIMQGEVGDWLICGIHGEFYPCKDEIFKKTYEKV